MHVQLGGAPRHADLGPRREHLGVAALGDVADGLGLLVLLPILRAEGERDVAPAGLELKLLDGFLAGVEGRRGRGGGAVALAGGLAGLALLDLLADVVEEVLLLLLEEGVLRVRLWLGAFAARAQVRDLLDGAGAEVEAVQVVAPLEDDVAAVEREAGVALAVGGAGEAGAVAVGAVVDKEVAVLGVYLALEAGVIDVLAVVPPVEDRARGTPLGRRHLDGRAAAARHLEERVGREAALRVPVEIGGLPVLGPERL